MTAILRQLARAFSSYRRWHAEVLKRMPPRQGGGRLRPLRPARVADAAVVRRVRCLSEPCSNSRLALALLRTHRTLGDTPDAGIGR